jgi:hypothetical protein
VELVKVLRLGAKAENLNSPMKLTVETVGDKWKIITGAKKLKETRFSRIGITLDLSKKQRVERKKLKDELEQRKHHGETNLSIRNGKIVKTPRNSTPRRESSQTRRDKPMSTSAPNDDKDENVIVEDAQTPGGRSAATTSTNVISS